MRERVFFKIPEYTQVEGGGHETTWEPGLTVWAKAEPYRSRTGIEDSQFRLQDAIKFTIRYMFTLQATWLIQYKGHDYVISSIKDIQERDRFQEIIAFTNNDNYVPVTT